MDKNYIARKLKTLKELESKLPQGNIEGKNIRLYRRELNEIANELEFDKYEFEIPYYEIFREEKPSFRVVIPRLSHFYKPNYEDYCEREVFLMKLNSLIDYLENQLKLN